MKRPRAARTLVRHLQSNVIGYLALFVALGGVAYAGARPLLDVKGSVDSANLKAGAVKGVDIAPGAISKSDLSDEVRAAIPKLPPPPGDGTYTGTGIMLGSSVPVSLKAVWRGGEPTSFTMTSANSLCVSPEMKDPRQSDPITFYLTPPDDGYRQTYADLSYLDGNEVILNGAANAPVPNGPQCIVGMTVMRLSSTG